MRPSAAHATGLALGLALASCGKLLDEHYRPPPLAVLRGTLHQGAAPAAAGPVLLALAWQSAGRTAGLFQEVESARAAARGDRLICASLESAPRATRCDGTPWSGHELCQVTEDLRAGLTRTVAAEARLLAPFTVPVEVLPPASARYELSRQGGTGTLALASLVAFVDEDGDGLIRLGTPERPPEPALASSAMQRYQPPPGTARASYFVALLDGSISAAGLAEGQAALLDLPRGFSLLKRHEVVDASGTAVAVSHAVEPIGATLELFGYEGVEGRSAWCTERVVERVWLSALPPEGPPFQCAAGTDWVSCQRTTATAACRQIEERFEKADSCALPPPPTCLPAGWAEVGPMLELFSDAVLLRSGKVLVFGTDYPTTGAWILDPATGYRWRTGSMVLARSHASATVLHSGKVLVAGGSSTTPEIGRSAELYDPATGTWTPTGSMATARYLHSATLLPSGKVLVVGGVNSSAGGGNGIREAELYDPAAGTWSPAAPAPTIRYWHSAVLLRSGKVLVSGLHGDQAVDLYDPAKDTWETTGSLATGHQYGTFTLLPRGEVLALGHIWGDGRSAERYEPVSGTWRPAAPMPRSRAKHGAAVLPSGKVLVVGGTFYAAGAPGRTCLADVDVYDPATDTWSAGAPLNSPRSSFATVPLPSGEVLVVGGDTCGGGYLASMPLFCEGAPP